MNLSDPKKVPLLKPSIALISLMIIGSCQVNRGKGQGESYMENGELWAYGSVELMDFEESTQIYITKLTSDQSVDATYTLSATVNLESGSSAIRDVAYVDLHPQKNRLLAYSYRILTVERSATQTDVYALLRKEGRSYRQKLKVYLGYADMTQATKAPLTLAKNLKLDVIGRGVYSGSFAMHYADVSKIKIHNWQGICAAEIVQAPGQNPMQNPKQGVGSSGPRQNPGQFKQCDLESTTKIDFCDSDPTKDGCRPSPPAQSSVELGAAIIQEGLEIQAGDYNVFKNAGQKGAKITFSSKYQDASSDDNSEMCGSRFSAVARTIGGRINSACALKPAPADPVNGKLSCAISVQFTNARTYLEKVCNITVTFNLPGSDREIYAVQVLKK